VSLWNAFALLSLLVAFNALHPQLGYSSSSSVSEDRLELPQAPGFRGVPPCGRVSGQLEIGQAAQESTYGDLALEPRKRGTETEAIARAKR
jgi:hypothetical protein